MSYRLGSFKKITNKMDPFFQKSKQKQKMMPRNTTLGHMKHLTRLIFIFGIYSKPKLQQQIIALHTLHCILVFRQFSSISFAAIQFDSSKCINYTPIESHNLFRSFR